MKSAFADKQACRYISQLIHDCCGIQIHHSKEALIKSRLGKRIRHHGLTSLPAYCDFLRNQDDGQELTRVVDALTTHFTGFLREQDHFQFMIEHALPSSPKPPDGQFHVWSAASSSGEEAYTSAFYLAEHSEANPGCDWRVCASDVSAKVLDKARLGVYTQDRLRSLPRPWVRKYFQKGIGRWEGYFRVKRIIADHITFRQINLLADYTHPQPFQVIFLCNVLMYLHPATREQLVNRVCRFLAPKGHLLIGHSEDLNGLDVPLYSLRPSIYQHIER
jgi:chemotaxis protein methyltransferase CheR